MHVLVAYASRHGATQGIAELIASTLSKAGLQADLRPASAVKDLKMYDAFVIGSAAYMAHWEKDATELVKHNRSILAARPVWLFSSGPLGTEPLDPKGRDQKVVAVPKGVPELAASIHARDHRVFFGAFDRERQPVGFAERVLSSLPAAWEALPQGDFRDWPEIEAWATSIIRELQPVPVG